MDAQEGGFATIQFVMAMALSLLLVTMLANLIVFQYGRGVVRAALDEGARRGSRAGVDQVAACNAAVTDVLGDLAAGSLGDGVAFHGCTASASQVKASATATFEGWMPTVPDWTFAVRATATREREPVR